MRKSHLHVSAAYAASLSAATSDVFLRYMSHDIPPGMLNEEKASYIGERFSRQDQVKFVFEWQTGQTTREWLLHVCSCVTHRFLGPLTQDAPRMVQGCSPES